MWNLTHSSIVCFKSEVGWSKFVIATPIKSFIWPSFGFNYEYADRSEVNYKCAQCDIQQKNECEKRNFFV